MNRVSVNKEDIIIRIADWSDADDRKSLSDIRRIVFIEEQGVPESLEWDEHDNFASHFLVLYKNKVIASARLKPDGQLGRMAVLPDYRNQGIGSALLRFILKNINTENYSQIYLHAQNTAISFYEKQGFICRGELFYEANIPHREMLKKI